MTDQNERLKAIKREMAKIRKEYKGIRRISFMNRTTPKIARGQAFDKKLAALEVERDRLTGHMKI